MALPQAQPGTGGALVKVYQASNGSYYTLGNATPSNDIAQMYKASAPSGTWSAVDTANSPSAATGKFSYALMWRADMEGTGRYIACVYVDPATGILLRVFDTSTDTWASAITLTTYPTGTPIIQLAIAGEPTGSTSWLGVASSGTNFAVLYANAASGVGTSKVYSATPTTATQIISSSWAANGSNLSSFGTEPVHAACLWDGTVNRMVLLNTASNGTTFVTKSSVVKLTSTPSFTQSQSSVFGTTQDPYIGEIVLLGSTIFFAGPSSAVVGRPLVYKSAVGDAPTWTTETVDSGVVLSSNGTAHYGPGLIADNVNGVLYYFGVQSAGGGSTNFGTVWKRSAGGVWGVSTTWWPTNSGTDNPPSTVQLVSSYTRSGALRIAVTASGRMNEYSTAAGSSSFTCTATDSVSVSDAATRGGAAHPRTAVDSTTVSDAAARVSGLTRTTADSTSVSDAAVSGSVAHPRTTTDSASVSDAATRASLPQARATADSVSVSDSGTGVTAHPRTTTDTSTVSDAALATTAQPRTATDSVSISDAAVTSQAGTGSGTDAVTISDAASRATADSRAASDSVPVSDAAVAGSGRSRSGSDTVACTDAATAHISSTRTTPDLVAVSDATLRGLSLTRTVADFVVVSDSATRGGTQGHATAFDVVPVSSHTTATGPPTGPPPGLPTRGHVVASTHGVILTATKGRA